LLSPRPVGTQAQVASAREALRAVVLLPQQWEQRGLAMTLDGERRS
jgi:hypothetical protein